MNDHPSIPAMACPRCDYDLAGTAPQPGEPETEGRCPECGLAFAWSEVRDRLPPPPWSLEPDHRVRWFRIADRAVRVLWHVLRPATLWEARGRERRPVPEALALAHPVRGSGLAATALAGFAAAYLAAVLVAGAVGALTFGIEWLQYEAEAAHAAAIRGSGGYAGAPAIPPSLPVFWAEVRQCVLLPGVPWTSSAASTRWSAMLSICGLVTAVVMPMTFLLLGATLRMYRIPWRHVLRMGAYAIVQWPLVALLFSLATGAAVLLAGVADWLLYARAAGLAGAPGYAWAAGEAVGLFGAARGLDLRAAASVLRWRGPEAACVLAVAWVWVFWYRAASRYLRLPRAGFDTTALMVVAVVAGPVALVAAGSLASKWMGLVFG